MFETEVKIEVSEADFRDIEARLKELGAHYEGTDDEKNYVLDFGSFFKDTGRLLRLRENGHYILTYKGKLMPSAMKKRVEIEFGVGKTIAGLLRNSSLNKTGYDKIRSTYSIDGMEVMLDKVEGLGYFVEIEGANEAEIDELRERLAISGSAIQESYMDLLERAK